MSPSKLAQGIAITAALVSCTRRPPPSAVGDAKTTAEALSSPLRVRPETPAKVTWHIEDGTQRLEVQPLVGTALREARAIHSSDGQYALEGGPQSFVVRASSTPRVVFQSAGWFARWVSQTEVAWLGAAGELIRFDVTDPSKVTRGGRVCGSVLPCDPQRPPPQLEWVSRDLDRAVVRGPSRELFVVQRGEVAPLEAETHREAGARVMARAVSKTGSICIFTAAEDRPREPPVHAAAHVGNLRCAEPPWVEWRAVRELAADGPFEIVDEDAQVKFFSEQEVLVSLPSSRPKYVHCLVALPTAATRCTTTARPEWFPLGDGRWAVEHAVISTTPSRLIDAERDRSWPIGDGTRAVWWEPKAHGRVPFAIVLRREDKANVQAGTLSLPASH